MARFPSLGALLSFAYYSSATASPIYDYVIVGGGLSGLVTATRLTEQSNVSVLVLEYGDFDRRNLTKIPGLALGLNAASLRLDINSAPVAAFNNATFDVLVGATVGGGSQVNGMAWELASGADYDAWEMLGNPGWGWEGLQPFYKKAAHFGKPLESIEALYNYSYNPSAYGPNLESEGQVQVSYAAFQYQDSYHFIDALNEIGIPFVAENALAEGPGHFWMPADMENKNYTRSSALYAYYDKVSYRKNLELLHLHQVQEILFSDEDMTATGVRVLDRTTNQTMTFSARKEVILAAGAVFTPQLLQISGIGPKSVLEAAGVATKLDFPAVGSNFQDHPVFYLNWNITYTSFPNPSTLSTNATFYAEAVRKYYDEHTGPLTLNGNYMTVLSPDLLESVTDMQGLISELAAQEEGAYLPAIYNTSASLTAGYEAQRSILLSQLRNNSIGIIEFPIGGVGSIADALQKPLSRGTVHLNATYPAGPPVVAYNALNNPFDQSVLFAGVEYARKMMAANALATLQPVELLPGPQAQDLAAVIDVLVNTIGPYGSSVSPSFAHPASSCPMMPQELGGVVDSELRVYGTKGLRIVDASILPMIPGAHLQATMYAVAEKAADVIKSTAA